MSRTEYDKESNILKIVRDDKNNAHLAVEEHNQEAHQLRAFILTVVNNEEELKKIQAGENTQVQLFPVLAKNEEDAQRAAQEQGHIVLNLTNYEILKFQTNLLEQVAENAGVTIHQLELTTIAAQ